ncbi:MAG TPA: single-stranded-DNA-specific exonuclease RecJ [Anaerolineales bacterium]
MTITKRWLIPPPISPEADTALAAFPPLLRQVLFNRGYATDAQARAFLKAEPGFNTDPFQMTGVRAAVDRISHALAQREPIAIYGDYDVDGVTATALMVSALRGLDADVRGYIPNRFDEGYGLNKDALDHLKADGVKLVITVDCGIRSPEEARHARAIGLDLVITDHHHPSEGDLPVAMAVINPKQPGDVYPDKDLAGVGLAYKLVEALLTERPSEQWKLELLLDLVALGTVADLAPLVGENRSLVRKGLRQMRSASRQGLFALAAVADVSLSKVNAGNIGFMLGPRLNASGRLESALASFELLITTDVFRAGQLAQQLDVQNRQRQALTRETQEQAEVLAMSADPDAYLLFASHESFNAGVVGLAAARLMESHYRPAIVAATNGDETRGSCRSIPEFHITDALDQCADLLVRHGGHAAAAGFTVKNANLEELIARLKAIAAERLGGLDLRPTLTADAEVSLTQIRPELIKSLGYLDPTGYGNPDSAFVSRGVKVKGARTVGADGRHLKLSLEDDEGFTHDAIGFRLGPALPGLTKRVDLLYTYEVNEFNGRIGYQLNLKDIRPAGTSE